jgi:hypothetical protein
MGTLYREHIGGSESFLELWAPRIVSVRVSISKTSANLHKTSDAREGIRRYGSAYARKCMCEDVSDRVWYNVQLIEERKEVMVRRNEEVSKRLGGLSNGKLFLRG